MEKVLVIVGPTAVGKTALSVTLAQKFNGEIISGDSLQIYKHLDIGTAKIKPTEMMGIPHHLIDVIEPDQQYSADGFSTGRSQVDQGNHRKRTFADHRWWHRFIYSIVIVRFSIRSK